MRREKEGKMKKEILSAIESRLSFPLDVYFTVSVDDSIGNDLITETIKQNIPQADIYLIILNNKCYNCSNVPIIGLLIDNNLYYMDYFQCKRNIFDKKECSLETFKFLCKIGR